MDEEARAQLESTIRALASDGDHGAAVTALLRGYGPEVLGFLLAVHSTQAEAYDAFSEFAEAAWLGFRRFAWESTARTWAYAVARNVSRTQVRNRLRRDRRRVAASDPRLEEIAEQVRTSTASFLRTEKRTRLRALRESLPEEDRMLLVLRLDRGLSWNELARVMSSADEESNLDDATIAREAARLRKRFQLVKDRLRAQAKREGLV